MMSVLALQDELTHTKRMLRQLEPLVTLYKGGGIDRDVTFSFGETTITRSNLKAVEMVFQELKLRERNLKAELTQPLKQRLNKVTAPAGSILERRFTGTFRGRQIDLLKK